MVPKPDKEALRCPTRFIGIAQNSLNSKSFYSLRLLYPPLRINTFLLLLSTLEFPSFFPFFEVFCSFGSGAGRGSGSLPRDATVSVRFTFGGILGVIPCWRRPGSRNIFSPDTPRHFNLWSKTSTNAEGSNVGKFGNILAVQTLAREC